MKKRGIPLIKIEAGDNYDFGFKLGKALKKQIRYRLEKNKELYRKKAIRARNFSKFIEKAKKFLPAIKKNFPELLVEAEAMAEGAEVPFSELLVLMCEEETVDFKMLHLHCTSVVIKTKNKILLGNNEDWFPEYRENGLALVRGQLKNNKFLALTYIGNLAGTSCGLNKYGIAYTDNSFNVSRFCYGVPRSFHLRALLDAKNIKQAVKVLDCKGSVCSNTIVVHSNKSMVSIEELWNHKRTYKPKNFFIHTNHPLKKEDQTKENTPRDSIKRYKRAEEILLNRKFNLDTLKKIFKDHKGEICEHPQKKFTPSSTATLASVIMNPKDKWMLISEGNPCRNKYKKYYL